MNKPSGYDQTQAATGDFKTLAPGGYICRIKKAQPAQTKTGREQLIILFDIEEGEFKGYYQDSYTRRSAMNSETKWQGVYRQLTEGNSLPFFKGMLTAIEQSNPGYTWNWDEKTLAGKLCGIIMGQEEYIGQDGTIKLSTKPQWIRSIEQIKKGVKVPEVKKLKESTPVASSAGAFGSSVFPGSEEIPF